MVSERKLRITPLGGAFEIGKNSFLFEADDQLMLVDCGLKFPEQDMLGIDIVIPDFEQVIERQDQLLGLVLTHGHEDHIGSVPYLLERLDHLDIYGTQLTLALLEAKLDEWELDNYTFHEFAPGDEFSLGPFKLHTIRVSHSIPDGVAFGIETPGGRVLHTGDFKFDPTPIRGKLTDFAGLARLGEAGVDLMLCDVTNIEKPGFTPSEQVVVHTLESVMKEAEGRIIVASFASNLNRLAEVMRIAEENGRRVFLSGLSMQKNVRVALRIGLFELPEHFLVSPEELPFLPSKEICVLSTGAQGEPMSGLSLMSAGWHQHIQIEEGDTVILSASPIPGNEAMVFKVINDLYRAGARVIYDKLAAGHVSGHSSREGIKLMTSLVQPRYAVPIHGEPRHSFLFKELAGELGLERENVLVARPGQAIELVDGEASLIEGPPARSYLVDGREITTWSRTLFRERKALAQAGVVVLTLVVDKQTGEPLTEVAVGGKGFAAEERAEALQEELRLRLTRLARELAGKGYSSANLQSRLVEETRRFLKEQTGRKPVLLPHLVEI